MAKPPFLRSGRAMGHLHAVVADPLGSFLMMRESFPDEEMVRVRFGPFVDYVITGAEAARQFMLGGHENLVRPWFFNRVFKELSGLNLFTANGEAWAWRRKMIGPAFHTSQISSMAETMVTIAERTAESWDVGDRIDLTEAMSKLTLEVAGQTMFGVDINADDRGRRLAQAFEGMIQWTNYRVARFITEPIRAPTPRAVRARRSIGVINSIAAEVVQQRRATGSEHHDLLQLLVDARNAETGQPLDEQEIVSEAKAFFFAGHETTSSALAWAWFELARNPEVAKELTEELASVLGGRSPRLADLEQLDLTRRVMEETLRLHPPAMLLERRTKGAVEAGGYVIPRNRGVFVAIYAIHRNPRYWANPNMFDPDRFTPAGSKGRPPHAFIPFGEGPRMCIGSRFAMTEACLVLATLSQRRRFHLDEHANVEPDTRFVLKPSGLSVVVVR